MVTFKFVWFNFEINETDRNIETKYRRANSSGERGEVYPKLEEKRLGFTKNTLILEKGCPFCAHLWFKFSFKMEC